MPRSPPNNAANPCGCNLADCVVCNEWAGRQWDDYEEDGPMDLEDQLEAALDRAFPPNQKRKA